MTRPRSISQSTVEVMGIPLVVHQLDTGERVVEAESAEKFFAAIGGPSSLTSEEVNAIMAALFPEAGAAA